ncbi:N-acyl homoserine lactonase family protein [Nonomuraea africana]|uniref:Glyoxylase-like metal-dependent hydrolase (Beta-lactamase superfamily II) n=1 Tax=Nonomuraea africana TaxID=46171 RepID=A0ABR9K6B9_9ACTN|nr:N-acyl homoserine lactonase family protein [Nonomuraea africana]MBE1557556.1 glyoxylase-like metal-dependent hydrolase (beta-lactamase superfamily II) [Nonomuraea africana]
MTNEAGIKRVSMVSTGSVSIHPEHVSATRKPMYWWLFTSRRWTQPLPINVYVIEHRDGLVLFDTGQDRASVTDPDYFPGGITGVMYDRLARFDIGPEQTLTAQLAAIGYDIGDVHTAVISHLHQDHIGGLRELTGAQIVVSRHEWETLEEPAPQLRGLLRSHIDLPGLRWRHISPEPLADPALAPFTTGHDLFDDGSMVLLPTPGHTPGSLSMLVRGPGRTPLLMVGDLTYDSDLLEKGIVPGVGEKRELAGTTQMVNELRLQNPALAVLAAHDPGATATLAAAVHAPL